MKVFERGYQEMLTKPPILRETALNSSPRRRRRFSPLMLIGISVPLILVLVGGVFIIQQRLTESHAAAVPNPNCSLLVPDQPLTAQGLATPYQLSATNPANGPCNEANANQSAFVQGAILNPATGQISIYSPLVIDAGTQPLVAPTAPTLPPNAIVTLHFGFNGTLLTLTGNGVANGRCTNGLAGSVFGQFAYCNAINFFNAANADIALKKLVPPPLGTALDGKPCPTVRDFSVVDMDQSDNVQTQYLVNGNGQVAQLTAANQAQFPAATPIGNPSDNALVSKIVDPALGCKPWTAPDLANNNTPTPALVLDELEARQFQQAPIALVPAGDEMVLVNNNPSLTKVNAYRLGVDQTPALTLNNVAGATALSANTIQYCVNIINTGVPRILLDQQFTMNAASPAPATANNLFTFLATRLQATLGAGGLNCTGLLNINNPVTLTTDGNGVTTAATIVAKPVAAPAATNAGMGPAHPDTTFHHNHKLG
jgi:hypothetical protein